MAERKSFTFFISYWEAIEELPEKEQLPVLKAIIKYAFFGEEPKFKGIKQAVFLLVKPTLDKSKQKAANGKQGGSKPKANRKQTASDISEDKEEDKGIGIGVGIGTGVGTGVGGGIGEQSPPLSDSDFEIFFERYPVGIAKDTALDAWRKLPQGTSLLDILDSLDAWKLSKQWKDQNGRYIPRPAKWLSEAHWKIIPDQDEGLEFDIKRIMGEAGLQFNPETGSWVKRE